jgi:ribosomal-protein-alanine N-acetyltransferase
MEIETESFPSPWSGEMFEMELERRRGLFLVAEETPGGCSGVRYVGAVAGFICSWVVEDECHIFKVAVRRECRRRGIGSLLLEGLTQAAVAQGVDKFWLEVRRSNGPAVSFYRRRGYQEMGLRKGYYSDTGEDAVVMARFLGPPAE